MFTKPITIVSALVLVVIVALFGGMATNTFIKTTSTTDFCISCHEMENTVYQEYKKSIHYQNPSGVRATCADCHIPHDWGATLWRKVQAAKDVYHHLVGTIDTTEKFETHRLEMAKRVWASMKASDSRECRNCHHFDAMDLDKQRHRAISQHRQGMSTSDTCIDCHKGIAHKPAHEQTPADDEELKLEF